MKIRKDILIKIIFTIIVSIFIILLLKDSVYKSKLRNIDTDYIEKGFTNVYADLLSIEPITSIYKYNTKYSDPFYGEGTFEGVICKCKTVEGNVIWASFSRFNYPGINYSSREKDFTYQVFTQDNPCRIKGTMKEADDIAEYAVLATGKVLVMDVSESLS